MKLTNILLCTLVAGGMPKPSIVAAENVKKPNIIYIMADDLGIGDLGGYG